MRLKWHGHSCFEVSGKVSVLMDPHDGESIGLAKPKTAPDIVLVSHDHHDHNAISIAKGRPAVVKGAGQHSEKGVKFIGVETWHDELGGKKRGNNIVYVFTFEGVRFAHMGDLGHVPTDAQAAEIGRLDILMVPVGGLYTIDAKVAMETIAKLKPRVAVPMHYKFGGLKFGIARLSDFTKRLPAGAAVREVGSEMEFEAEDLPERMEYWLFTI
jgi:L-ascorbate metabolism protein UlaG (beta-lactamase superfamily)